MEPRLLYSSISGTLFNDANDNGIKDSGETGLSGWTVYIDANENGNKDTNESSSTTSSSGAYTFSGVCSNTSHRVRTIQQSGWRMTLPTSGSYLQYIPNLTTTVTNLDFGETQKSSISGTLFNDVDPDGTKQSTEPALQSATAYVDANDNGQLDSGEPFATSNSAGAYTIRNISTVGSVKVRTLKAGWIATAPASKYQVATLTSGLAASVSALGAFRSLVKPSNFSATRVSGNATQVQLSWTDMASSESGYKVEQADGTGGWAVVATLSADTQSYVVTNVNSSFNHRFRVAAYDANGNSEYSSIQNPDLQTPTGVTARTTGSTTTLTWNAVSNATSYNIYTSPTLNAPMSATPVAAGITGTSTTLAAPGSGIVVFYTIVPLESGGTQGSGTIGAGALRPDTATTMIIIVPFAVPANVSAALPGDMFRLLSVSNPSPDYVVGAPKFNPNWGTFIDASAQVSYISQFVAEWSGIDNNGGGFQASGSVSAGDANASEQIPRHTISTVGTGFVGQSGSMLLYDKDTVGGMIDDPANGFGVNEVEMWAEPRVDLFATHGKMSISGFFSGFYAVTYHYTTPPVVQSSRISPRRAEFVAFVPNPKLEFTLPTEREDDVLESAN